MLRSVLSCGREIQTYFSNTNLGTQLCLEIQTFLVKVEKPSFNFLNKAKNIPMVLKNFPIKFEIIRFQRFMSYAVRVSSERNFSRKNAKFLFTFRNLFREISHFFAKMSKGKKCENVKRENFAKNKIPRKP